MAVRDGGDELNELERVQVRPMGCGVSLTLHEDIGHMAV